MEVHPVADLFPMLADDELAELAEDIKQRGLLQPIVLDSEGRVLDGRNRLAACELAGVEPRFETFAGDDPDGYALAVNIARRHLRAGARLLLTEQARRLMTGDRSKIGKNQIGNDGRLSEAATVLDYAPDRVENVLTGAESLRSAAEVARERKREAAEIKAKKDRLRLAAPDLAELVDDGRHDLDEALGRLAVREAKATQEAEAARQEAAARASEEERRLQVELQEHRERVERHRERIRSVTSGWPTMREVILSDQDSDLAREIVAGLGESDKAALSRIVEEIEKRSADE